MPKTAKRTRYPAGKAKWRERMVAGEKRRAEKPKEVKPTFPSNLSNSERMRIRRDYRNRMKEAQNAGRVKD